MSRSSPVTETVLKALEEAREEVCKTTHNLTVGYKLDGFDFAAEAVLEALGHAQCSDLEPTEAMLNAARDWSIKKYGMGIGNDAAIGCWKAMFLAASPDTPAVRTLKGEP
jgi:hypothetical protein